MRRHWPGNILVRVSGGNGVEWIMETITIPLTSFYLLAVLAIFGILVSAVMLVVAVSNFFSRLANRHETKDLVREIGELRKYVNALAYSITFNAVESKLLNENLVYLDDDERDEESEFPGLDEYLSQLESERPAHEESQPT